ncbi:MAG: hypothetical protein ACI8Z7_000265 [Candidatus Nanohaloarchaea archaeon]|jgi:hypothetical protein
MDESLETKYTEDDFLELMDELAGAVVTFGQNTDEYIDLLESYTDGEINDYRLKHGIDDVIGSLDILYSSLEPVDKLIEDEVMVARIESGERKGLCDLEESLAEISNGIYSRVESLDHVVTVLHYMDETGIEADERYLRSGKEIGAPTRMIAEKDRILDLSEKIDTHYEKLASNEVRARQHTESDELLETYSPEPPIFRMLGNEEHSQRVKKLNIEFKEAR